MLLVGAEDRREVTLDIETSAELGAEEGDIGGGAGHNSIGTLEPIVVVEVEVRILSVALDLLGTAQEKERGGEDRYKIFHRTVFN